MKYKPRNSREKAPWLILTSPFSSGLSDEDYRRNLIRLMVREKPHDLRIKLRKLLATQKAQARLNGFATKIEDFASYLILGRESFTEENAWQLYFAQIECIKDSLSAFDHLRDKFETALLHGDYAEAENILSSTQERFGENLWQVKSRILLLSYAKRRSELEAYCNSIKERAKDPLTQHLFRAFQLISDSGNASFHHKAVVEPNLKEFSEADREDLVGLLRAFCTPMPLLSNASPYSALLSLQRMTILDTYTVAQEIICHQAASSGKDMTTSSSAARRSQSALAEQFAELVPSEPNRRILSAFKTQARAIASPLGRHILDQYECGNYEQIVATFERSYASLNNPLAYLNIVAKALAYLSDREIKLENALGVFINHLARIYRLDKASLQSWDILLSEVVRLRSLSVSHHLQMALFKALPHRYRREDAILAARQALISRPEVTPLTEALTLGYGGFACESEAVGADGTTIPEYRKAKRRVEELIKGDVPRHVVFEALEQLRGLGILQKDYLELYADYCQRSGETERLIRIAAQSLVENHQVYICFPMEYLIDQINRLGLDSLEAVLVAQIHVRHVAQAQAFILHEAFEAFLGRSEVTRPSELLQRQSSRSPLMIAFFRDVCSLDTLDYLSCFKGTAEVHAERLTILDWLTEHGGVEPASRMRELEELVTRLIQDSAATELTGPRVYVDDSLVRRACIDEIQVLLQLFRTQPKEPEAEGLVDLSVEDGDGTTPAYAIGERNALLFRIWVVIRQAFLFDERNGLQKNISTEIKHGYFSNLMRSRLEEKSLITELGADGKRKSNKYWQEQCSLAGKRAWQNIDDAMAQFSDDIYSAIESGEKTIVVTTNPKLKGIAVPLFESDFIGLRHLAERADLDADGLITRLLELIWRKTEISLASLREYLNVDFRNMIDDRFEMLEQLVNEYKGSAALVDLVSTIRMCRAEIREDISTVSEWFRRAEGISTTEVPLDDALQIAVRSFEKVKGLPQTVETTIDGALRSIPIGAHRRKALTIALTNLFDNCFQHSGRGRETCVSLHAFPEGKGVKIEVRNDVDEHKIAALNQEFLDRINHRIRGERGYKLLIKEGGTGIGKAYHELLGKAAGSDLTAKMSGNQFIVEIYYAT